MPGRSWSRKKPLFPPGDVIILCIDDEPLILAAVARTLRGHEVVQYRDACAAIAHLLREPRPAYDVVMCDLMMPDCSGVDLHRVIRRDRPELLDRIIFFTGVTMMPGVESFLAFAGRPVLRKPFGPDELLAAVMAVDRVGRRV